MKIAVIFPGQGAQFVGMGSSLLCAEKFLYANEKLQEDISSIIKNGPTSLLSQTRYSQLAIFLISSTLFDILKRSLPFNIHAAAGLSLGEYSALYATGALSFESTFSLVQRRGELMEQSCKEKKGAMSAVIGFSVNEVEEILSSYEEVWIANYNTPSQVVLSGKRENLEEVSKVLTKKGAKVFPLQVEGAFHSPYMVSARKNLAPFIDNAPISFPKTSLWMNVTGEVPTSLEDIKKNLVDQITFPVRWNSLVLSLKEQVDVWIEVGPKKTLSGMNRKMGIPKTYSIQEESDIFALVDDLGKMHV